MKKTYETAEINVVIFKEVEVLAASTTGGDTGFVPEYSQDDDETEIL